MPKGLVKLKCSNVKMRVHRNLKSANWCTGLQHSFKLKCLDSKIHKMHEGLYIWPIFMNARLQGWGTTRSDEAEN